MDLAVGLDIGSTMVKAVALGRDGLVRWKRYERHRSLQAETALELLEDCIRNAGLWSAEGSGALPLFTTGSGGGPIARVLGIKQFQEVNALCAAVERLHKNVGTVFEIGGQDSKFITWREGKGKFSAMNDRCAGGTGATIERVITKLNLPEETVLAAEYDPGKVYDVAGKCGVFAETDINSLQKQGITEEALILSLFKAVVGQNLSVLARGHTPHPDVLLLGGPNVFLRGLREAWRESLLALWAERGVKVEAPTCRVYTPENALYYGAIGAALMGFAEGSVRPASSDLSPLVRYIEARKKGVGAAGEKVFFKTTEERNAFFLEFAPVRETSPPAKTPPPSPGAPLSGYIGVDGGSTSTKGVVLDENGEMVASAYKLSEENPLRDARSILLTLKKKVESAGRALEVAGIGYTGYAKDLLRDALGGTCTIVETVAHTLGAQKYFPDAEVICDVGGQDIKIIILEGGVIRDFRLNTQCSAGNGYYLQSTAGRFGYEVERYADAAFGAKRAPVFNFGCAVFLESDIVNFQQLGWQADEIMAGLALVLPLNVWLYVAQEANLARLGRTFVLQGGTHNNLAVVKAQADFIRSRVPDAGVFVHPYKEVAGAIGAALEAAAVIKTASLEGDNSLDAGAAAERKPDGTGPVSDFIGFESLIGLSYGTRRGEDTRCTLCKNRCMRTLITVQAGKVLRRFTVAQCERGRTAQERSTGETIAQRGARPPNFIEISNKTMFHARTSRRASSSFEKAKSRRRKSLESAVIGIPRVLNVHSTAPFFKSYFEHLGAGDVRFSSHTSERLYKHTLGRGSIDPCFPSKIAVSHVYSLLNGDWVPPGRRAAGDRVTHIFFPCIRTLRGEIHAGDPHWSCPVVSATPEVVKASLTLEKDEFAERGVRYLDPVLDMAERDILERQMYEALGPVFHIRRRENREAIEKALKDWGVSLCALREKAEETILELERTNGTGIVVLARPYHNDPGINHGILERLNRRGFPIFSIESLPRTGRTVERLFGRELESGAIEHPLDVREEWPRCYSENTSLKVWAARFAARHPNLVALDLSSFRCGHDAPLYSVIDDIFRKEASPYFTFHEIDENKPIGSIKLRVETIDYFLGRRGSCHDRRYGVRSISRYNLRLDRTQGRHPAPVLDREGMQCLQSSSAV